MEVIKTASLVKSFDDNRANDHISLQVNKGEIYGFLGLNGAGKTTLIRMLLGMIKPDSGSIYLFGKQLNYNFLQWNDIGYLVETPYAYPNLSVTENLKVYALLRKLNNASAINNIIEQLKLTRYKKTKASHLSLGNQQRLGLAKAMMHHPKLLILDEPINGLDPEGIIEVRELLKELARNGSTIFLSSHNLAEVSKIATRIGIIHQGKLLKEITVDELSSELIKKLLIQTNDNDVVLKFLRNQGYEALMNATNEIEMSDKTVIEFPENISKLLIEKGFSLIKLIVITEDLERYFIRQIKK